MLRLDDVILRANGWLGAAAGAPSRARFPALNIAVERGAFRWVLGPAGAGKTDLLDIVALRRPPAFGRVVLLGVPLGTLGRDDRARLRRRLALIEAVPTLHSGLTLRENIVLPLRIRGVRAAEADGDATAIADWLGIGRLLDRGAATLSRGERQLGAVARAVVGRPELLLADEPLSGLSVADGARVLGLLAELNRLGTTVLLATADERHRRLHPAPSILLPAGTHENGRAGLPATVPDVGTRH